MREIHTMLHLKTFSLLRAFPGSKVHPAAFGATPQLMHLALSGPSIMRKCHENVISIVMADWAMLDLTHLLLRDDEDAIFKCVWRCIAQKRRAMTSSQVRSARTEKERLARREPG
jgi:hypothetical protein